MVLLKKGAAVVGVPPGQAGNCYIDTLGFELNNSGIKGSISYKNSLAFPDNKSKGEVLPMTEELTYAKFRELRFDPNAAVLLALKL
jgi:hypothetical protein